MRVIAILPLALAVLGCATYAESQTADAEPPADETVRYVGEPENCVQTRQIRSTDIVDDRTIDFHMHGGKIYRNDLPQRCPGLKIADAFGYKTSISRLCSVDIITVVRTGAAGGNGARCGLGTFREIERIEP